MNDSSQTAQPVLDLGDLSTYGLCGVIYKVTSFGIPVPLVCEIGYPAAGSPTGSVREISER